MSSPHVELIGKQTIALSTSLLVVAAIAAQFALVVQIKRLYESAVFPYKPPVCPEEYTLVAVLGWLVLGSLAVFAIRRHSVTQLAGVMAVSCGLVTLRVSLPSNPNGASIGVFWPVACFGLFFVTPHLLVRFKQKDQRVLVYADAAIVTLLAWVFAVQPYVPRM